MTSWVGFAAATLTTVAFVPQVLHTLRTRDTRGISLAMYSTFTAGVALWLVYGLLRNDAPIIISNIIVLLLSAAVLVLKLRHG